MNVKGILRTLIHILKPIRIVHLFCSPSLLYILIISFCIVISLYYGIGQYYTK